MRTLTYVKKPIISSIGLGIMTSYIIGLLDTLFQTNKIIETITGAFAFPGAVISAIFYPEGPHTGDGVNNWAYFVLISNLVIYIAIWYSFIKIIKNLRRPRSTA